MLICKKVLFSGQVQGVGFRWTTRRVAAAFRVAGYVRNLSDGRVELVVEGEDPEVEAMIEAVHREMVGNIEQHEVADEPLGQFGIFEIR